MLFQFHKGTIKTTSTNYVNRVYVNFNSIKVRLKHGIGQHARNLFAFQFHKGTIKTKDCDKNFLPKHISIP